MPSKHSPGYKARWEAIRREATRRLIGAHRDEYEALIDDVKARQPMPTNHR